MLAALLAGAKMLGEAVLKNVAQGGGQPNQAQNPNPPAPAPYTPGPEVTNVASPYDPGPQVPTMTSLPKAPMVPAPAIQDPNKRKLDVMNPQ